MRQAASLLGRERLLAEDVDARFERGHQHGLVERPGRRDDDCVEIVVLEGVFDARADGDPGEVRDRGGRPCRIRLHHGGHSRRRSCGR